MNDEIAWSLIERYFLDNPQNLVKHHIQSYNDFYKNGIFQIFREKNPITIYAKHNEQTGEYDNKIDIFFGGKEGNRLYFGKPIIYDSADNIHYMYPNEARLRNMTYAMTIHYDIEYEVTYNINNGEKPQFFYGGKRVEIGGDGDGDADDEDGGAADEGVDFNLFSKNSDKSVLGMDGGGPKRVATKKVKFSSAEAAAIKEETAKSMVSPSTQKVSGIIEKIFLGKFPVMVQSDFCILSGLSHETRFHMGECRNDYGGYFIIDGKEKVIIPQEKFADNMMYIEHTNDDKYLYLANLRSVSENASKPIRTLKVGIVSPTSTYSYKNIVVEVPNVKKPVPLFILLRALGVISDKDIIQTCLLDLEKYDFLLDLLMPSVHDGAYIMTQSAAIQYIATLTKQRTISTVMHILSDFLLPHVGELNFQEKAYHLGNMVLQLLLVYSGVHQPTDRDNFKFKRVDTPGNLLYDLFKEYYNIQQKYISLELEKRIHFGKGIYENDLIGLLQKNYQEIFKERILERGFSKAYKGNWGAFSHTKRLGIVQDLNRLSYNSALNHMRKITLPLDSTSKVVGPRMLNSTHWGIIDPIDTPDGGNIGLHKHMSIITNISDGISRENMLDWLRRRRGSGEIIWLSDEPGAERLSQLTKIFVNGLWIGGTENPFELVNEIRMYRRNGLIPFFISVTFEIKTNSVFIFTDSGRLCRPVLYRDEITKKMSYENKEIIERLEMGSGAFTWQQLMCGFSRRRADAPASVLIGYGFYEPEQVYDKNPISISESERSSPYSIIDFMDTNEEENAFIALSPEELSAKHTHLELHKSLIFGLMCNMIPFPECAPATRNSFSCGQSKQAVSLYSTNFPVRMDKMGVVLNYGQIPLVKTRYLDLVNREENPYGENVIVAIMCYTGYNVEDAILINEGAINRGCFQTTYFTTYTEHEETANIGGAKADTRFSNIEKKQSIGVVVGTKPAHDYSSLDEYGLIRQGTPVNDKTIMIGVTTPHGQKPGVYIDKSITTKKGQIGIVDKTFITDNEEGQRIAKVRIMEQRMPGQGDKFASRSGQKGTIGLIIPECDMPFTRDGIRPDLILNPHAFPTRQTINQLVETMLGKACLINGSFGDGTAYMNRGLKYSSYGELLSKNGFHSSGNEVLYNGMTGEQIESEIFIGPTYYMRLKHMVKDKINYRARGPTTMLTRQPVQGRANDGGLRIGEMEVSAIQGHGMMEMLTNSVMDRSDKYHLAICNKSGMILIYNPDKNLLFSPVVDGPIKFTGSMNDKELRIENISRFGREFSIVAVPYSFKLLIQELAAINIQIRIITEDNIEHMENMMYNTENLRTLTGLPTPEAIVEIARKRVREGDAAAMEAARKIVKETVPAIPQVEEIPAMSPASTEEIKSFVSPPYPPSETSPYAPLLSNDIAESEQERERGERAIRFDTNSPPIEIESPPYAPETPPSRGGGKEQYKEGDTVFMLNDLAQQQPWTVTKVGGGGDGFNFITLLNPNATNDNDAIRVVLPYEITGKKENTLDVVQSQPLPLLQGYTQTPFMMGGAPPPAAPPAQPLNINVYGGSDFSLSTGSQEPSGASASQTMVQNGGVGNGLDFNQPLLASLTSMGMGNAIQNNPGNIGGGGGGKDTASSTTTAIGGKNIIVKKLG